MQKIDEKNRMGETRDLSNKIRVTKGIFHAKIRSVKLQSNYLLMGGVVLPPCLFFDLEAIEWERLEIS